MSAKDPGRLVDDIDRLVGDPKEVDRELQDFRRSSEFLASSEAKLVKRYPNQWIAVSNGRVSASGKTLSSVLHQIDAQGLRRERTLVRFLETNPKTLILQR